MLRQRLLQAPVQDVLGFAERGDVGTLKSDDGGASFGRRLHDALIDQIARESPRSRLRSRVRSRGHSRVLPHKAFPDFLTHALRKNTLPSAGRSAESDRAVRDLMLTSDLPDRELAGAVFRLDTLPVDCTTPFTGCCHSDSPRRYSMARIDIRDDLFPSAIRARGLKHHDAADAVLRFKPEIVIGAGELHAGERHPDRALRCLDVGQRVTPR